MRTKIFIIITIIALTMLSSASCIRNRLYDNMTDQDFLFVELLFGELLLMTNGAQTQYYPWITDNTVNALAISDTTLYVGGTFNEIAANVRNGAILDAVSGAIPLTARHWDIDNTVYTSEPDGQGGWYIGGSFNSINGLQRRKLARVNADGSLHPWNPDVNVGAVVNDIEVANGIVYAVGLFSSVNGGVPRNNAAAFDGETGAVLDWDPDTNNQIATICIDNGRAYLGGWFTNLKNTSTPFLRDYIAGIGTTGAGTVMDFDPDPDNAVRAIRVYNGIVYFGGDFLTCKSMTYLRTFAAASNTISAGSITGWMPNANGRVYDIEFYNGSFYLAGNFDEINSIPCAYLARVDPTTGTLNWPDPQFDFVIQDIDIYNNIVYCGGNFNSSGGFTRNYAAAVSATNGSTLPWDPNAQSTVNTVSVSNGAVFAGGNFTSINRREQPKLAAFDITTGRPIQNFPRGPGPAIPGEVVNELVVSGTRLYVGGSFTNLTDSNGTLARSCAAAINLTTNLIDPLWDPNVTGGSTVRAIAVMGNTVYLGGQFTNVNIPVAARTCLAAVNDTDGTVIGTWSANIGGGTVEAIEAVDGRIFVGGNFTVIKFQPRDYLAEISAANGDPLAGWIQNTNGIVSSIRYHSSGVYVAGIFTTPGYNVMRLSPADASILSFPETTGTTILSQSLQGSILYLGGNFSTLNPGAVTRNGMASIDITTQTITAFDPAMGAGTQVNATAVYTDSVFAGGSFMTVSGRPWPNLVRLDPVTGKPID